MKPATREWVKKAENDFETAVALIRRKKSFGGLDLFPQPAMRRKIPQGAP